MKDRRMNALLCLSLALLTCTGSHEEESTTADYDYERETATPDYDYNATFDYYYVTGHYHPVAVDNKGLVGSARSPASSYCWDWLSITSGPDGGGATDTTHLLMSLPAPSQRLIGRLIS
ncbi:hypothetical protein OYC64_001097 [Pagothenia borchgrevinki]|uniref:Uncharacterized protein n=1 Tax=Pagothenia borchgrevinki TaxID=8213 RepID=A0ABD2HF42_PAGBO